MLVKKLQKGVSLFVASALCLLQAAFPGGLSSAAADAEASADIFLVLTDAEILGETTDTYGLGRDKVSQSSEQAHGGAYSMKYAVKDGEGASLWNDRKEFSLLNLSAYAATREEIALSFWVYTDNADQEADFVFKFVDQAGNRAYLRELKKTAMAPTAGAWHQVTIPLKNGEFSQNFNWKYIKQWALESAKGTAYTLWVDDIALVRYPVSPYTSLLTLADCDATAGIGRTNIALNTATVHDGTGSFRFSPPEGQKISMWYTPDATTDYSVLGADFEDLALSFWVYAESTAETDKDIAFVVNINSTQQNWDGPKLTYTVTKDKLAPAAGQWRQVVVPLTEFTENGAFDWAQVTRWRLYQYANGPAYTMYIDQLEIVSLVPPITGMSFTSGKIKIDLSKPFEESIASMEAWILVDSLVPDDQAVGVILGNTDSASVPGDGTVRLSVDTGGNPLLLWNGGEAVIRFDADVRTGRFLHLAVIRDAAAGEFRLYIDGRLADTREAVSTDALSDTPYVIGSDRRRFQEDATFDGWIGDLRVWSVSRTAEEIAAGLRTELTGAEDGLLGNWRLRENILTDDTAVDVSANGNHGVIDIKGDWVAPDDTAGDFTLVALPDTQTLLRTRPELYPTLFQWIADNAEKENIQYVMSLGDNVDDGGIASQWETAKKGFALLDGKVPYTLVPGNHDYINWGSYRPIANYNSAFPAVNYAGWDSLQGLFEEDSIANSYHCFSVQGIDYMILALEFMPRDAVLEWACQVVEAHPRHNVIVTTHAYLTGKGERETAASVTTEYATLLGDDFNAGEDIWNKLVSRYGNIFMVLSGHVSSVKHDIRHLESVGENGNTVHQIMANAQFLDGELWGTSMKTGGLLLLLRFSDYGKTVNVDFYSPIHDLSYREENRFSVSIPGSQLIYAGVSGVEDGATYDLKDGAPVVRFDTGTVLLDGRELSSGHAFTAEGAYTLTVSQYGETGTLSFTVVDSREPDEPGPKPTEPTAPTTPTEPAKPEQPSPSTGSSPALTALLPALCAAGTLLLVSKARRRAV